MQSILFVKMHGCGNDFVIIDGRSAVAFQPEWAARIADRHTGVGCDQLIVMEPSKEADIFMRIYNADGSQVDACGNATRCIGWLVMEEKGADHATIETNAGLISCERMGDRQVRLDMGMPKTEWQHIPLAESRNTTHLGIEAGNLADPVAVNMGNPHAVFFVTTLDTVAFQKVGPVLEVNPLFPEKANISAVQVIDSGQVKARVWERGAGLTLACGTAACAIVVAGVQRGLIDRKCTVSLPGGDLQIEWCGEESDMPGHVLMTGPVAHVFEGEIDTGLFS